MRYLDNGNRKTGDEAVFPWLNTVLTPDVVGISWQSGYFDASVLGVFACTLERLASKDLYTAVLVGSNDGVTSDSAVSQLVDSLELPRRNAQLGIVCYSDGFYHPKTIHLSYVNHRQMAYVGSANLTSGGLTGLNVEAGITLDTAEGDSVEVLSNIRRATSDWFDSRPDGFFPVAGHADIASLRDRGILVAESVRRSRQSGRGFRDRLDLPRRGKPLVLPPLPVRSTTGSDVDDVLLAHLIGPGRWSQAAFPKWFIYNFFKVQPDTGDLLQLIPVTQDSGAGISERVRCGYKDSKNWYYELALATRIGRYPTGPAKPIAIFHRVEHQAFRYAIIMPDDGAYSFVSKCLMDNRKRINRPRNELPRTTVSKDLLNTAWPGNWFFRS